MPLWTHNGAAWRQADLARVDTRAAAFLCCPGPSLAHLHQDLRGPGRVVCAINSAYPQVRPDVWIGLDRLACHDPRVWFEAFVKVTRYFPGDTEQVRVCPEVYYADLVQADLAEIFLRREAGTRFVWQSSTFLFALHYLVWRGHKRIHLVGCDHHTPGGRDYHDDRVLTPEQRTNNAALHARQLGVLRRLAPLARRHGVEIVSSTPGSALHAVLPFETIDAALARCVEGMPGPRPLLHSLEADAQASKIA